MDNNQVATNKSKHSRKLFRSDKIVGVNTLLESKQVTCSECS